MRTALAVAMPTAIAGGRHAASIVSAAGAAEATVTTPHAFTGRMCAGERWKEAQRSDSLFHDHLAAKLAGSEGRAQPMGSWIMIPRTRYGDDLLRICYETRGVRQLVLLGAGMDARAYRMQNMSELRVFEVDQKTTFDVKEPLLEGEQLTTASRVVVATEFTDRGQWSRDLEAAGFDRNVPSVWLLEGLVMYLSMSDTIAMMKDIGFLSANGSAVFHDAISAHYLQNRIVVGGAPFIGGSDEYSRLWKEHAGFANSYARSIEAIRVDRPGRRLVINDDAVPEATPEVCRGRDVVLFVEATKG